MQQPVKTCPNCGRFAYIAQPDCERCGYAFPDPFDTHQRTQKRSVWPFYLIVLLVAGAFVVVIQFLNRPPQITPEELIDNSIVYNGRTVALRGKYAASTDAVGYITYVGGISFYFRDENGKQEPIHKSTTIKVSPGITTGADGAEVELTGVYDAHNQIFLVRSYRVLKPADPNEYRP